MKYVSIDIETTGLYAGIHQILEIGAVIEDQQSPLEDLPVFHKYVLRDHGSYLCHTQAILLNIEIIKKINQYDWRIPENHPDQPFPYVKEHNLIGEFYKWLKQYGIIENVEAPNAFNVGGKNFIGFDYQFLKALPYGKSLKVKHRVVDPAILYFNPSIDTELPDLQTCLQRAGIDKTVSHTSVEDSYDVIKLVRKYFNIPF